LFGRCLPGLTRTPGFAASFALTGLVDCYNFAGMDASDAKQGLSLVVPEVPPRRCPPRRDPPGFFRARILYSS
jgi:hypothetical protein